VVSEPALGQKSHQFLGNLGRFYYVAKGRLSILRLAKIQKNPQSSLTFGTGVHGVLQKS
jgi:hypothetical protein